VTTLHPHQSILMAEIELLRIDGAGEPTSRSVYL